LSDLHAYLVGTQCVNTKKIFKISVIWHGISRYNSCPAFRKWARPAA